MAVRTPWRRWHELKARHWSSLVACRSIVRGLPLLATARPKTPLRVLCIMAFDALPMLRRGKPLPLSQRKVLAAWLDFAACANAAFDQKDYCRREFRRTLRMLQESGLSSSVVEYLRRLCDLERRRPAPGGDDWQFPHAVAYREAVVRLSLGMTAVVAGRGRRLDDAVAATRHDADFNLLFRIVMQCQILDDVLDYPRDSAAGLPSFLTASSSLVQAFEQACLTAARYADIRHLPRSGDMFPLRAALFLVSTAARLVLALGRWRHRARFEQSFTKHVCGRRRLAPDGVGDVPA
ncbi:MAG TPA: hypothetical protein VHC19_21905 [Pirellulales bacterium]|nr:hypothetical protein [Pirellulales bacterium]